MAFRSRKLAKALALAVPCSSFVCPSQVSCVIHRWQVDGLDGLYNDETKDLYIDGGGKIDKNSFKNTTSFPVKDVKRIFIGTGLIVCDNAFADFDSLKSVIISYPRPGLHLSLRKKGCSQILSHLIESYLSERKIGGSAFCGHGNLTNVTILGSVTEIGDCAFFACTSLENIQLPESLLKIGANAFQLCKNLKSIIIPNSVTEIEDCAFYACTSLENIQLPESLLKIGEVTFGRCTALKKIIIPNSVTEIENSAFYGCESLEEAYVPKDAKIGKDAFPTTTKIIRR